MSETLKMPPARDFGWRLRDLSTSFFDIQKRENGQFTVVLNHALLRGVRAEMIAWWFQNFTRLRVKLTDIPGYEGKTVPGYLLWHPSDHVDATLKGEVNPDGNPIPGKTKIHIREAMQYLKYQWRFPVDTELTVYYCGPDGWAMGKSLPILGPAMMLRIHFKDAFEGAERVGVHYHYEVVIGVSGTGLPSRLINRRLSSHYGPEFFTAWHTHNVIEVGVFENFLPALYTQAQEAGQEAPNDLIFARNMDQGPRSPAETGFDRDLFENRVAALSQAKDPFSAQAYSQPSFL